MKKITLSIVAVLCFAFSWQSNAQHTFAPAGPVNVQQGTPVNISINDAANTAGVSAGIYNEFVVTVAWTDGSNAWSSEADLAIVTAAGSVLIDPPSMGALNSGAATSLTFSGSLAGDYDPSVDGTLNLVLRQSWAGSNANWSNITVTVSETPTGTLDYYNLQWPPNGTIIAGETFNVYAQAYEAGLTDATAGQAPGIESWIGYSTTDTDPSGAEWTWVAANFNVEAGNNDEYTLNLGSVIPTSGTFYYASRWSLEGGPFTYGGILADGSNGGAWGENNNISGVLTVNPPANDDCANAIGLTVNTDIACGNVTAGTTTGATASSQADDVSGTPNNDVWYFFVAESTSHSVSLINRVSQPGGTSTSTDMGIGLYDGTAGCSSLVLNSTSDPETYTATGLILGVTYYVRVYGWFSSVQNINFDLCIGTPPPPPTNDTCEGALTLNESVDSSCANAVSGTTVDAFGSASGTCSTTGKDVWYTFTPSTTGNYNFTVSEVTDYGFSSTYVTLYSGDCGATTQIGTSCTTTSISNVALTASTTYYVVVRTTSATTGVDFSLCAFPTPPPPANDTCEGALTLNESIDSSCASAVSGTTVSATPSASGTCSTAGKDVWYTFTPLTTANYNFSVSEVTDYGTSSTYVTLYSGDCGSTTQIGSSCSTTSISDVALTASTTYYVVVRTTSTTAGVDFSLCAYPTPPPPANDTCEGALTLNESADATCANIVSGTTVSATPSASGTCSTTGKDVWYTFIPSQTGDYIFGVTETQDFGSSSTYMQVYSGSCGETTQVGTGCFTSSTTLALTAATQYYVVVRSTSSTAGVNFDLCAYPAPPVPANDACSGANVITALPYNFSQTDGISATNNDGFITACNGITTPGSMNDGLWFTFTPDTDGTVDIVVSNVASGFDPQLDLYSGSCGAFTCVASADTGFSGGGESIIAQAVTGGTQYFINVGNWSGTTNNPEGSFDISVSGTITLGIESVDNNNGFTYFPNPVKNALNLKAQSNIQNVSIFNMLGQEILRTSPNALNSEVDMASLQTGAYFVKVTINDAVETIRVIKQ